jgi:hypothetical protein
MMRNSSLHLLEEVDILPADREVFGRSFSLMTPLPIKIPSIFAQGTGTKTIIPAAIRANLLDRKVLLRRNAIMRWSCQ